MTGRIEGLDGVRAFAVLAVLAFHLWPNRFPGGFIGVDVFFVISGFLITTLLLRERSREGWIDLPAFWLRRARRLVPAIAIVVPLSIVVAGFADRDLLVGIERQALGALTFSSNWLEVVAGVDYFDHTASSLFVTFWSLAVEEQFYLLWPVLFALITTLATRATNRVRVAAVLAVASAVWMAVSFTPGTNPTRVYYGTDTHLFGLMIGAALAFAFAGDVGFIAHRRWWVVRRWAGFVVLAVLAGLVTVIDASSAVTYRGGLVVASLLSAVAVACLPGPSSAYVTINRAAPLAWIGERSYGIYLWHWPVIAIVTAWSPAVAPGSDPDVRTVIIVVAVTAVLTEVSYRWVEMPVRNHGFAVVFAPLWEFLAALRRPGHALARGSSILGGAAAVVVAAAAVSIATAPEKSQAQLAVERGERAIAAQGDDPADPDGTPTPDTVPAPPSDDVGDGAETTTTTTPPPAWPADLAVPPGDLIVGYGDSVLSGAAPAMFERFPGIRLDAKPIRQWRDAPALVAQAVDGAGLRPVVVLQFGTNAGLESAESEAALHAVLEALGPHRRVVLVNIVGVSAWVPASNQKLAAISAQYPNTIVADWHSVVAADPTLLHSDRTHPNMAGIAAYADLVAAALDELGPG